MLAHREQVAAAMLAALQAAFPAESVARNRRSVVDASEAPFLNLLDGGHTVEYDTSDAIYTMQVVVDAIVTAPTDAEIGPALNALYAGVLTALMADPTLGGLCTDIREDALDVRVAPTVEADTPLADFTLSLVATFRTPDGNPGG